MIRQETKDLLIYGAGGHAKVVCDAALHAGFRVRGFLDDDPERHGQSLWDLPIMGGLEWLEKSRPKCALVLAIGDNRARQRAAERLAALDIPLATVVHPSARLGRGTRLGEGTVVLAGAVVNADTLIGRHGIVNTGATVDHDCVLGDFVHIAPGAHLAGGVRVGNSTLIGIGACLLPGVCVGEGAVVGAGAVVVEDLPDRVIARGVPARVVRSE